MLVLDSGGVSRLGERSTTSLALIRSLRTVELWPPLVPTAVLVECLHGHAGRDAKTNQFLKACILETRIPEVLARRAAELRRRARRGSAVDAVVIAFAEPGGTVLTGDVAGMEALAAHARNVSVEAVS